MADESSLLKNYTVAVRERGKSIKFLRRIIPGGADRSYGLHVARLAGLPEGLLRRAEVILEELEGGAAAVPSRQTPDEEVTYASSGLFTDAVTDKLLHVDVMSMTPIEAISFLHDLQREAKKGSGIS